MEKVQTHLDGVPDSRSDVQTLNWEMVCSTDLHRCSTVTMHFTDVMTLLFLSSFLYPSLPSCPGQFYLFPLSCFMWFYSLNDLFSLALLSFFIKMYSDSAFPFTPVSSPVHCNPRPEICVTQQLHVLPFH